MKTIATVAAPVDEGTKSKLDALRRANVIAVCQYNATATELLFKAIAENMTLDDIVDLTEAITKIGREGDPADR